MYTEQITDMNLVYFIQRKRLAYQVRIPREPIVRANRGCRRKANSSNSEVKR